MQRTKQRERRMGCGFSEIHESSGANSSASRVTGIRCIVRLLSRFHDFLEYEILGGLSRKKEQV